MTSEKELNVNLLERLNLIERIEAIIDDGGDLEAVKRQLAIEKKQIKRMLYQKPALTED